MPSTTTSYAQALDRLLRSPTLPKLGLRRMEALCEALGRPQDRFASLHIAGTKGKGSTSAMTASVLRLAGLRVGLTTSPHLLSARERIVIDGAIVDEATFVALEARVDAAARTLPALLEVPSFFERLTAMALCAFADAAVDVAVIEVGLGGRLDATNVVRPLACAITRLGMDHMEFLGPTLAHIAAEKAGIIKAAVPVVTTTQDPEAAAVIARVAERLGAPLTLVVAGRDSALRGAHQRDNAAIAATLVRVAGLVDDDDVIAAGLAAVRWPGRYETVATEPLVIVDGAHDGLAAAALAATIVDDERLAGRPLHAVVGVSRGHAPAELLEPLALVPWASVVATQAAHPRALPGSEVARAALRLCPVVDVVADVVDAVAVAVGRARSDGGVIVVTGSLFVVGEARAAFIAMPADPQRPAW
jgi:dihydrofolate synthase/folylpolyglutamate synthase